MSRPRKHPKWEYLTVPLQDRAQSEELTARGAEGWELVSVVNFTYYFKRPV